jgi:hypothetical protein
VPERRDGSRCVLLASDKGRSGGGHRLPKSTGEQDCSPYTHLIMKRRGISVTKCCAG